MVSLFSEQLCRYSPLKFQIMKYIYKIYLTYCKLPLPRSSFELVISKGWNHRYEVLDDVTSRKHA